MITKQQLRAIMGQMDDDTVLSVHGDRVHLRDGDHITVMPIQSQKLFESRESRTHPIDAAKEMAKAVFPNMEVDEESFDVERGKMDSWKIIPNADDRALADPYIPIKDIQFNRHLPEATRWPDDADTVKDAVREHFKTIDVVTDKKKEQYEPSGPTPEQWDIIVDSRRKLGEVIGDD